MRALETGLVLSVADSYGGTLINPTEKYHVLHPDQSLIFLGTRCVYDTDGGND